MLVLAACASAPAPKSIPEQIAYSYGVVASIRMSAADMLTQHQLTVAQAENVQVQADTVRKGLDQARIAFANGVPQDAQSQLLLATQVLTALQDYLQAKRK